MTDGGNGSREGVAAYAALRARLEHELVKVLRSLGISDEVAASFLEDAHGSGTRLPWEQTEDQRILSELRQRGVARARALTDALRRMDEGSYGACTTCGKAISPARLDVLPDAVYCQDCAGV